MILSTRNFVDAGSTNPETRLITIRMKPTANNPRRGRISCQISGSALKTCVFFAGFFCSSFIDVRLLGFLDPMIRCETREHTFKSNVAPFTVENTQSNADLHFHRCKSANHPTRSEKKLPSSRLAHLSRKRKGHPATGRPSLQGRIVPTEARPSKLSAQILGWREGRVKQFIGLKLLYFQQVTMNLWKQWKMAQKSNYLVFNYLLEVLS